MKLYVKTTKDDLELPVAVARSGHELAEMTGTDYHTIMSAISHGYKGWYRVEVDDDDLVPFEKMRGDLWKKNQSVKSL